MAAYDFPDTLGAPTDGSFVYTAPTGEKYSWNGYSWVSSTDNNANTFVKRSGDSMTGGLEINAKATSYLTQSSDPDNTLATKGYVDQSGGEVEEAPADGQQYARQNKAWSVVTGGGAGGETKADIYGTAKVWGTVAAGVGTGLVGCTTSFAAGANQITFDVEQPNADYKVTLGPTMTGPANVYGFISDKTTTGFKVSNVQGTGGTYVTDPIDFVVHDNEPAEIVVGSGTVANTNLYGTAKAWANVAGDGTLRSGTNCSVSKTGVGVYAVTFTEPMPDADYTITMSSTSFNQSFVGNQTVNGFTYNTFSQVAVAQDFAASFAVFDNEPAEVALTTFGDVINYNGASAWGYIEGSTQTLTDGMNIASVVYNGSGDYSVTFATPMPNATYSVVASAKLNTTQNAYTYVYGNTASGFNVLVSNGSIGTADSWSFVVHAINALPPKGGTGTDAWVSTTSGSTGAIGSSFNIDRVERISAGVYDVFFITPMPTNTYSVAASSYLYNTGYDQLNLGSFRVRTYDNNGSPSDAAFSATVNATNAQLPNTVTQEQIESAINNPGLSAWGSIDSGTNLLGGNNIAKVEIDPANSLSRKVTFQTPMPDDNYSVVGTVFNASKPYNFGLWSKSTTGFSFYTNDLVNGTPNNSTFVTFQVAATNALPPKGGTGTDAWASVDNANTVGPVNVSASFNVKEINRDANGMRTVVFETPMPTANYSVVGTAGFNGTTNQWFQVHSKRTTGFDYYLIVPISSGSIVGDAASNFQVHATNATLPTTFTEEEIQAVVDLAKSGSANGATAWGNVEANGTLNDGLNVSVTKAGTGLYKVTFNTPMPNGNYSVVGSAKDGFTSAVVTSKEHVADHFIISTYGPGTNTFLDAPFNFTVHSSNVQLPFTVTQTQIESFKSTVTALEAAVTRIQSLEATVQAMQADHTTLMNNNGGY